MRCEVVLSRSEPLPEADCWLVIDILRATTTICAFFDRGGERLYPAATIEEAFALRDRLAEAGPRPILMGERNALPPDGFDLGNSPLELAALDLAGRTDAVMATTNGTAALLKAAASDTPVLPVCARNAAATAAAVIDLERIGILCAGREGASSLDDCACAGLLVERLSERGAELGDGAILALAAWRDGGRDLAALLTRSVHGRRLVALGFERDLAFATEIDASGAVLALESGAASRIVRRR